MSEKPNPKTTDRVTRQSRSGNDYSRGLDNPVPKSKPTKRKATRLCHGCLKEFDYDSNKSFVRNHHLKEGASAACLESLHKCKGCSGHFLTVDGLSRHIHSCPKALHLHNNQINVNINVENINASQFGFGRDEVSWIPPNDRDETVSYAPQISNNQQNIYIMAANLLNTSNKKSRKSKEKETDYKKVAQADQNSMDLQGLPNSLENNLDCGVSKLSGANLESNDRESFGVDDESEHHSQMNFDMDCDSIVQDDEECNQTSHKDGDVLDSDDDYQYSQGSNSNEISPEVLMNMKKVMRQNIIESCFDSNYVAALELESILRRASAPLYLFDEIMNWGCRNVGNLPTKINPITRKNLYKQAAQQMYGTLDTVMRPFQTELTLPSGRLVSITRFQLLPLIFNMLECPYIDGSNPKNLIFDGNPKSSKENPFAVLLEENERNNGSYDDIQSSVWYQETLRKLKLNPKYEMLVPFIIFLDAATLNAMSSHSMEPLQIILGIFKRLIRYDPKAWRTLGFIEDPSRIVGSDTLTPNQKVEDYHYMLNFLLEEVKSVIGSQGLRWKFIDDDGIVHERRLHFRLMMIIGDTKGADNLVGRFGSHWNTKGLSRDCDIPSKYADDPTHKCKMLRFTQLEELSIEQLSNISMKRITNHALRDPPNLYGSSPYGICAATPPDALHVVLLGIMIRLYQFFKGNLSKEQESIIQSAIAEIIQMNSGQGAKTDMPDFSKFATGNINQGHLSGKQKYARIFVLYMALLKTSVYNSFKGKRGKKPKTNKSKSVGKKVITKEATKNLEAVDIEFVNEEINEAEASSDNVAEDDTNSVDSDDPKNYKEIIDMDDDAVPVPSPNAITFDEDTYAALVSLLEQTLGMYEWLTKKGGHARSAFIGGSSSPVAMRLTAYMETYRQHAPRFEGMGLKLYKFHILKKWNFYICLYGSPLNIDSSMCEHGHIENLKQVGRLTQQRAGTLCEQTAQRYYEKCLLSRVAMLCLVFKMISKYRRDQIISDNLSRKEREHNEKISAALDGDEDEDSESNDIGNGITSHGPYYRLTFEYSDNGENSKIRMQWLTKRGGKPLPTQQGKTSFSNYVMDGVRAKLHNYNGGGLHQRIKSIDGASETTITKNNERTLVRAVPSYRKGSSWNDWVTINWEEADAVPAKVHVILDYDTCTFESVVELEQITRNIRSVLATPHDIKLGIHMVVHSASHETMPANMTKPFITKIGEYHKMEMNVFQHIHVDQIVSRIFVVTDLLNKDTNVPETIISFQDMARWSELFFDYDEYLEDPDPADYDSHFSWEELE